jgi:hypothetical protein
MSLLDQQITRIAQPIRVLNAVAAGTSDQNSSWVDCQNCSGVVFIALFGTLTSTQVTSVKLQGANASDKSDATDLLDSDSGTVVTTGALADADSNKMLVLEVHRLKCRYVRAVVDRGTANAVIDGVVAMKIIKHPTPATKDTTQAIATVRADYVYI